MKVETREGKLVTFDQTRITLTVERALEFMKVPDYKKIAKKLSDQVTKEIKIKFQDKSPHVEKIQDMIEKTLIKEGHAKIAKVYVVYRERHENNNKKKR
ncbi:MAG: ATP cone domain-containing protein [Candidatus Nanoarchaeia archaeon]|nr:ATP cone domain-containing protein [Candidatus Nanoarchaeia archaeon]